MKAGFLTGITSGLPVELDDTLAPSRPKGENAPHAGPVKIGQFRYLLGKSILTLIRLVSPATGPDQDLPDPLKSLRGHVRDLLIRGSRSHA